MRRRFNITGLCIPSKHYMVDLSGRLEEIRSMVDDGSYFSINRGRQFGKTTILHALTRVLTDRYLVVHLDFQALGSASYKDENTFSVAFCKSSPKPVVLMIDEVDSASNNQAFLDFLAQLRKRKRLVYMILSSVIKLLSKPSYRHIFTHKKSVSTLFL